MIDHRVLSAITVNEVDSIIVGMNRSSLENARHRQGEPRQLYS